MAKNDGKHHSTKKSQPARKSVEKAAKEEAAIRKALQNEARRAVIRRVK